MENMNASKQYKIIAVTPAGRKKYLEILSKYILKDSSIDEWHLWDNCRNTNDRDYINSMAKQHEKIKIIQEEGVDGSNRSISKFYKHTRDADTFYIRIDDDIVYLPDNFGFLLYSQAVEEKEKYSWWSPVVINNAICTYLLYAKNIIDTNADLTAQATSAIGWGSPVFAAMLHNLFLKSYDSATLEKWKIKDRFELFLQRFSVNTIGFFGDYSKELGDKFCPGDANEEEYISAKLPILTGKPGRLIGDILVAHFSFYTQETFLLKKTDILQNYARIAGISNYTFSCKNKRNNLIRHIKHLIWYDGMYSLNHFFNIYPEKETIKLKLDGKG
ncbi:MAG: hypothetical protein KBG83_01450 [Bacteroidetes bacterium]|nr:hypothetical protein [Bacteroidota bacterium]